MRDGLKAASIHPRRSGAFTLDPIHLNRSATEEATA